MTFVGSEIEHKKFGKGIIADMNEEKIRVKFELFEEDKRFSNNCVYKYFNLTGEKKEYFKKENADKRSLLKKLQSEYGFEGFHHYTDINNFIKIINSGYLLSREEAKKTGFVDAADENVITHTLEGNKADITHYVRFFYKEKTPTLYCNEGIKINNEMPHMPIPVLLIFDEKLIFNDNVCFLSGGGGSYCTFFSKDASEANKKYDWDLIFSRGKYGEILEKSNVEDGYNIKNARNAEFAFLEKVELKYLKRIIFRSEAERKLARILIGNNPLFEVEKTKFNCNRLYLQNYNIRFDGSNMVVNFAFNLPEQRESLSSYSHKLIINYQDAESDELNLDITGYYRYHQRPIELKRRKVISVEYYLNGYLCGLWKGNENK